MKPNVYVGGRLIGRDDPILEQPINTVRYTFDAAAGTWAQYSGVHGGGSPVMEKIGIRSQYDLESKKKVAKYLAGIED